MLHHDDATPHTALIVRNCLTNNSVTVLSNPPRRVTFSFIFVFEDLRWHWKKGVSMVLRRLKKKRGDCWTLYLKSTYRIASTAMIVESQLESICRHWRIQQRMRNHVSSLCDRSDIYRIDVFVCNSLYGDFYSLHVQELVTMYDPQRIPHSS